MVAGIPFTASSMLLFSPWMKFWLFAVTENIISTYIQPTARSIQWSPENLLIHTSWSQQTVVFTKIPINLHSCKQPHPKIWSKALNISWKSQWTVTCYVHQAQKCVLYCALSEFGIQSSLQYSILFSSNMIIFYKRIMCICQECSLLGFDIMLYPEVIVIWRNLLFPPSALGQSWCWSD